MAAPEAAGPERREVEGGGLVGWESEAAFGEDGLAGAGLDSRPDWVGAFVDEGHCGGRDIINCNNKYPIQKSEFILVNFYILIYLHFGFAMKICVSVNVRS